METAEKRCAFVNAQVACMAAELAAMSAQNAADLMAMKEQTYKPEDFRKLPDQYLVGHNAVISYLRDV